MTFGSARTFLVAGGVLAVATVLAFSLRNPWLEKREAAGKVVSGAASGEPAKPVVNVSAIYPNIDPSRADWGDHNAKVVGQSFVYFVERDETAPDSPTNGMLSTKAHVRKVRAGLTFDYCAGQANAGEVYDLDCHDMQIWSTQAESGDPYGNVY